MAYGYKRENKSVFYHKEEIEIVIKIYELTRRGYSGQAVADHLNEYGYTRRNGKPWVQRQVCRVLRKKKLYLEGLLQYGDVTGKNTKLAFLATKNYPFNRA